jgi:biopolymer transport protein ExbD
MTMDLPEPQETEMNMTPMIDIVFQLIIFFLLSLKFKTIDQRIDSQLPKDRGPTITQRKAIDEPKVKVKLFRRNSGEASAFTRIRIDNSHTFDLPAGDWDVDEETAERQMHASNRTFEQIAAVVAAKFRALGGNSAEVSGEIVAARPTGGAVPHGDIMRVLDTFMFVGIEKVKFEGTPAPKPAQQAR